MIINNKEMTMDEFIPKFVELLKDEATIPSVAFSPASTDGVEPLVAVNWKFADETSEINMVVTVTEFAMFSSAIETYIKDNITELVDTTEE